MFPMQYYITILTLAAKAEVFVQAAKTTAAVVTAKAVFGHIWTSFNTMLKTMSNPILKLPFLLLPGKNSYQKLWP